MVEKRGFVLSFFYFYFYFLHGIHRGCTGNRVLKKIKGGKYEIPF